MKVEDITLDWLMARVIERDGCLIWNGSYGGRDLDHAQAYVNGSTISARKLVWELSHGCKMPRGYRATSICGELGCVHPDHIERIRHGSELLGANLLASHRIRMTLTKRKHSRFNEETVSAIRSGDVGPSQAVKLYGISSAHFYKIKNNEVWRDLSNPFAGLGA